MTAPRNSLNVSISLDRIYCVDEGDGPGKAELYLWVIFYKIDGNAVRFVPNATELFSLQGTGTFDRRNGRRDNLLIGVPLPPNPFGGQWVRNVDAGDELTIHPSIGKWDALLMPIPIADSIKPAVQDLAKMEDLPGSIGVVCALMEADHMPDYAAAGYDAFCSTFEARLNEYINSRTLNKLLSSDTEEGKAEQKKFVEDSEKIVATAVGNAISGVTSVWDDLGIFVAGHDQLLGATSFSFSYDELIKQNQILFEKRWKGGVNVFDPFRDNFNRHGTPILGEVVESKGEWKIFGHISATPNYVFSTDPVFIPDKVAIDEFRHRADIASKEGFVGGFPNFYYTGNVGGTIFLKPGSATWRNIPITELGNPSLEDFVAMFKAINQYANDKAYVGGFPDFSYLKPKVISKHRTNIFDKVGTIKKTADKTSPLDKLSTFKKVAGKKDDAGVKFQRTKGDTDAKFERTKNIIDVSSEPVIECGAVLLRPGWGEWRNVSLAELGNPHLSDIEARFRATQDYATKYGFIGGFPTFFHTDSGAGIECGTILINPAAAERREVLLWTGPA